MTISRAKFFRNFIHTLSIIRKPEDETQLVEIIPFHFNEVQQLVWDRYVAPALDAREAMRFIVLKARQEGISTLFGGLMSARFCWDTVTRQKVIAHVGGSTQELWDMGERMIDSSPFSRFVTKSGRTMQIGHSTYGCETAGSPQATRAFMLNVLHCSEAAMWPHPDAWIAAMQTVPVKGESWLFVESTAKGKTGQGELFYDEWKRASTGKTKRLTPIFLPWFWKKEYSLPRWCDQDDWTPQTPKNVLVLADLTAEERELRRMVRTVYQQELTAGQLAWRRLVVADQCRDDEDTFNQEYPTTPELAFIASGTPLFPMRDILWLKNDVRPGRKFRLEGAGTEQELGTFRTDPKGYVEVWKPPEPGHQYVIGADTSMGFDDASHSRSAAEVIDLETMEQVAEYDCASPTFVMARHLAILGRRYNNALLAPEITASGGGGGRELIVHLLKDHQYYQLYRYKHVDWIKHDPGRMWGWETNVKTRPRMIDRAIEAVRKRCALIHSDALLSQLQDFGESDTGRLEAETGKDDLFFAWSIALVVRSEEYVTMRAEASKEKWAKDELQAIGIKARPDAYADADAEWEQRYQRREGPQGDWRAL